LSKKAMRRALLLLLLASAAGAGAAPVPKNLSDKERITATWGKPEGTGDFALSDNRLTIRTKGEPVADSKFPAHRTLPRTTRTLTGDFDITVRLLEAPPPDPKARVERGGAYAASAGLFVAGGDYRLSIELSQRYHERDGVLDKVPARQVCADAWFTEGGTVTPLGPAADGKLPVFRITRTANRVSVSYHTGDGKWSAPHAPRAKQDFPDEVTVGVHMWHSTYQSLHATFDRFEIVQPKDTPPK
jgi:hypothetical protein